MAERDNGVFVCTECKSDQRLDPYTNTWVQSGMTPPCKMCGGVVIYVDNSDNRDSALESSDKHRGIGSGG